MLALTIAFVVAFSIGLLIGLTSMNRKVEELKQSAVFWEETADDYKERANNWLAYHHVGNRMAWAVHEWDTIEPWTQKHLKRQAARILGKKIKVPDEDHPISFP